VTIFYNNFVIHLKNKSVSFHGNHQIVWVTPNFSAFRSRLLLCFLKMRLNEWHFLSGNLTFFHCLIIKTFPLTSHSSSKQCNLLLSLQRNTINVIHKWVHNIFCFSCGALWKIKAHPCSSAFIHFTYSWVHDSPNGYRSTACDELRPLIRIPSIGQPINIDWQFNGDKYVTLCQINELSGVAPCSRSWLRLHTAETIRRTMANCAFTLWVGMPWAPWSCLTRGLPQRDNHGNSLIRE